MDSEELIEFYCKTDFKKYHEEIETLLNEKALNAILNV